MGLHILHKVLRRISSCTSKNDLHISFLRPLIFLVRWRVKDILEVVRRIARGFGACAEATTLYVEIYFIV